MGEHDDAQAAELVRAMCDLIREMTRRLAWLESRDLSGSPAPRVRLGAASLRRDIGEAQSHIDRLQRHYLLAERQVRDPIHTAAAPPQDQT